jgi:hypothetical protein
MSRGPRLDRHDFRLRNPVTRMVLSKGYAHYAGIVDRQQAELRLADRQGVSYEATTTPLEAW